jgi:hypothetical protein
LRHSIAPWLDIESTRLSDALSFVNFAADVLDVILF